LDEDSFTQAICYMISDMQSSFQTFFMPFQNIQ